MRIPKKHIVSLLIGIAGSLIASLVVSKVFWNKSFYLLNMLIGLLFKKSFPVLGVFVIFFIYSSYVQIRRWIDKMKTPGWLTYTTDKIQGMTWKWKYDADGDVKELNTFCPNCNYELDLVRKGHVVKKICPKCNYLSKSCYQRVEDFNEYAKREIEYRISSGKYRDMNTLKNLSLQYISFCTALVLTIFILFINNLSTEYFYKIQAKYGLHYDRYFKNGKDSDRFETYNNPILARNARLEAMGFSATGGSPIIIETPVTTQMQKSNSQYDIYSFTPEQRKLTKYKVEVLLDHTYREGVDKNKLLIWNTCNRLLDIAQNYNGDYKKMEIIKGFPDINRVLEANELAAIGSCFLNDGIKLSVMEDLREYSKFPFTEKDIELIESTLNVADSDKLRAILHLDPIKEKEKRQTMMNEMKLREVEQYNFNREQKK